MVTALATSPQTAPVARRLMVLSGVLAAGVGMSALYATTGRGLPCPFLALTGWTCPLCGGTRMGSALLRGDLAAAWAFNPAALVGVVAAALLGLAWVTQLLGGPQVRWPQPLHRAARRIGVAGWYALAAVAVIGYTVARNLS